MKMIRMEKQGLPLGIAVRIGREGLPNSPCKPHRRFGWEFGKKDAESATGMWESTTSSVATSTAIGMSIWTDTTSSKTRSLFRDETKSSDVELAIELVNKGNGRKVGNIAEVQPR
jgi:hypothetical protein